MGFYRGANTVTDGLVFGFDTGYPLVSGSSDSYKFNKGEPTTNLMSSNGLDFSLMSTYPNLSRTQVVDTNSPTGYACEMETESGVITTARIRFGSGTTIPTSTWVFISIVVKFERGPVSNIRPRVYTGYTWYTLAPLDGGSEFITSDYRRFGVYAYTGTNSGGPNPGFSMTHNNSNTQAGQITRWHSPQVEVKNHATPFTTGTRSNTNSLIDLKRATDIDLSDVSFDSNAQMVFDGTDDRITIPAGSFNTIGTNDFTVEVIAKNTKTSSYNHFFSVKDQYHFALKMQNATNTDRNIYVYRTSGLSTFSAITARATSTTLYYHIVCKREGDNIEIFLNGVSGGTKSGWGSISIDNNTWPSYIGWGNGSEYTGGNIPVVKLYNRALTPEEVQQNFNAVRKRFNI